MSPWYGKAAYLVSLGSYCLIRAPHGRRSGAVRVAEDRKGALEIALLAGAVLGTSLVPLAWVAAPLLSFADYPLRPLPYAAGLLLLAAGLWLFHRSHADLGTNWSITLQLRDQHRLVCSGVYARIRHPMYSAMFLLGIAQALFLPNWIAGPAYLVGFGLLYLFRVDGEERMMRDRFGPQYETYARRTRRLIPRLGPGGPAALLAVLCAAAPCPAAAAACDEPRDDSAEISAELRVFLLNRDPRIEQRWPSLSAEEKRDSLQEAARACRAAAAATAEPVLEPRAPQPPSLTQAGQAAARGGGFYDGVSSRSPEAWDPAGLLPGQEAGAGRGYAIPADRAGVVSDGQTRWGLHFNASNYRNRERNGDDEVYQKFETHTYSLEMRRGVELGGRPAEWGVRAKGHHRNDGFLDGMIGGFEKAFSFMFQLPEIGNPNRVGPHALEQLAQRVRYGGQWRRDEQDPSVGPGDIAAWTKVMLASAPGLRLAARVAANAALGRGEFTQGHHAGAGLTAEKKLLQRLTAHGDVRSTVPLEGHDSLGLALKRAALGVTGGAEFHLLPGTSLGAQVNYTQSPYRSTGLRSFDDPLGDITFGVSHMFALMGQKLLLQGYAKENFNPENFDKPDWVPHGDSDLWLGVKLTIFGR